MDRNDLKFIIQLVVPVLIFVSGHFFSIYLKKRDKKRQLLNSKILLETWIFETEPHAIYYVENAIDFANSLSKATIVSRVPFTPTLTLFKKISELNFNDYLSFSIINLSGFVDENSRNSYAIAQEIELLLFIESILKDHYNQFCKKVDELVELWNSTSNDFNNINLDLYSKSSKNTDDNTYTFYSKLRTFIDQWLSLKLNPKIVEVAESKFIDPLLLLINEEIVKHPDNSYAFLILSKLKTQKGLILEWRRMQFNYSELFINGSSEYKKSYNRLKDYILILESKKLVSVFKIK